MRSNSRLPAARCMCVRSACVGMPGRRSLPALRLHRAFSPVSTTILLRWGWGWGWGWGSLCFLAACLRSAVAGLQRSQRDSSSAACADPDGPARPPDPSFCRVPQLRLRALTFCFLGPPLQICQGEKNKHGLLEFTCVFASTFFPFFVTRSKK
jgi:hypothetical protein